MALLIVAVMVGALFLLHRFGLLRRIQISWTLVWRLLIGVLLALGALAVIAKAWSIVVVLAHLPARLLVSPSRDPALDILSTMVLAVALVGIWRRKKWGAYLVLARLAFTIGLQVFVYRSLGWHLAQNYSGLDNVLADFSGAAMWLVAFAGAWRDFS